jgi:hypothetical protein
MLDGIKGRKRVNQAGKGKGIREKQFWGSSNCDRSWGTVFGGTGDFTARRPLKHF